MRQPTPFESFVRFTIGFSVFIGVSIGVTFAVTQLSIKQSPDAHHMQAAAFEALVANQQ